MMTSRESGGHSGPQQTTPTTPAHQNNNLSNGQQTNLFPNWPYINNGNFTAEQAAAAQFLPFLPPSAASQQAGGPPSLFTDFNAATNPYYYQAAANGATNRPTSAISPLDLKYSTNTNGDLIEQTLGSSSTDGSPFEFNSSAAANTQSVGSVQGPNFYNSFIPDNYLSAMGVSADSYPSTSFMGMGYHNYYPYPSTTTNGASMTAMDTLMQQQHQQMASSMVQQWKYGGSVEKLSKSSTIKSSSNPPTLSQRAPHPPHKIGPGTNNVRVRTIDKYRTVYTDRQRLELEKEFRSNHFVTTERKAVLAGELQLTERQVKIWFQNRRAKNRKQEPQHRSLRMVPALRQ